MVEYVAWDGYNRAVSQRTCSAPFGNTFRAVVRRGRADDLLGDIPPRDLTVSDQGGRYLGDLKIVLKRTWPVEMGPHRGRWPIGDYNATGEATYTTRRMRSWGLRWMEHRCLTQWLFLLPPKKADPPSITSRFDRKKQ
ncbi:hypothetical protein Taro_018679, partial [Colocasia esculenta]|nr:hypothetical protein [Colocasia esculenta]